MNRDGAENLTGKRPVMAGNLSDSFGQSDRVIPRDSEKSANRPKHL